MKNTILLLSFLFVGAFASYSFVSNETENELGLPPCGAESVGYVYHPSYDFNHTLVFYVTGVGTGYSYSWEFTRQNGTVFYASGHNPHIVTSCAFGQRITNWKVTISGFSCHQILQGGQSFGAC